MYQTIMLDYADGIATIALNRPQFFHSLNIRRTAPLQNASFCSGADC